MTQLSLYSLTQESGRHFVAFTNPLRTPRPSQEELISILRDMETILKASGDVDYEFRVLLFQIAANVAAERHMCAFLVHHTQLLHLLFVHPVQPQEECDATMLINNVIDDCVQDRDLLLRRLKEMARSNLFACEVLCLQNNKLFIQWTEDTCEPLMLLYAVMHANPKNIEHYLQLLIKTLHKHNQPHTKIMLKALFETKNMIIINSFLAHLKPQANMSLFLTNDTLINATVAAVGLSSDIAISVAMLINDWALADSEKCFAHLACKQESMALLEQTIQTLSDDVQKKILDCLFVFWFNMFSMCTEHTIHPHFYLFALRAYHDMPKYAKEAIQVSFLIKRTHT